MLIATNIVAYQIGMYIRLKQDTIVFFQIPQKQLLLQVCYVNYNRLLIQLLHYFTANSIVMDCISLIFYFSQKESSLFNVAVMVDTLITNVNW